MTCPFVAKVVTSPIIATALAETESMYIMQNFKGHAMEAVDACRVYHNGSYCFPPGHLTQGLGRVVHLIGIDLDVR